MTTVREATETLAGQSGFLAALAAVQAEAPALPKDKTNPHFRSKFTGLETIVSTIGPLLHKHGLVWIAKPSRDASGPTLDYRLVHVETGEGEAGTMPLLLTKADSQSLGSALTYARRYALCSVLNLVSDDDDDGNSASRPPVQQTQRQSNGAPVPDPISQALADETFGVDTIDPAYANDLMDQIVAKHMTTGEIGRMLKDVGITVTPRMLKVEGGLLDITSGLTVPQAEELEKLLKEKVS